MVSYFVQISLFTVALLPAVIVLKLFFKKPRTNASVYGFLIISLVLSSLCIWFIDLEIPLAQSSFRESGALMPVWLAFVFVSPKYIFIGAMGFAGVSLRKIRV